ncbi:MAG: hypothetical protein H6722_22460 [Sandaracinus sp.]|nr:hypothetical protein [Myxococcales bacterium]MCB9602027.1 hypothetical protein [Sandaracinus sp.]MCB9615209.1 hypothetical protein [Sandaracinus sp.]
MSRVLTLVLAAASLGCAADEPTRASATSGAETPARESPACLRDVAAFGDALVAIAAQEVPAPSPEDALASIEWTPEWRAWNDLQSAQLRVAEGEDEPGAVMRHRFWVHALRAHHAALASDRFVLLPQPDARGFFRAGVHGEPDTLTVLLRREEGCWRLDDR